MSAPEPGDAFPEDWEVRLADASGSWVAVPCGFCGASARQACFPKKGGVGGYVRTHQARKQRYLQAKAEKREYDARPHVQRQKANRAGELRPVLAELFAAVEALVERWADHPEMIHAALQWRSVYSPLFGHDPNDREWRDAAARQVAQRLDLPDLAEGWDDEAPS